MHPSMNERCSALTFVAFLTKTMAKTLISFHRHRHRHHADGGSFASSKRMEERFSVGQFRKL